MGFVKMVNEIDAREAANQGMVIRPLTQANIQKHLESVGLESEFATHSRMRGLSGEAKAMSAASQSSKLRRLVLLRAAPHVGQWSCVPSE